jgi:DNA-binding NtrC family response regulator
MRELFRRLINRWRHTAARRGTAERIPVLAITPDDRDRRSLEACSVRGQWDLVMAAGFEDALNGSDKNRAAVILCDRDLPGLDWRAALKKLAALKPALAIILISSVNDEYLWDEVIHRGGYDVLAKPLREDQTLRAVNLAWSYSKERMRATDGRG